MSQLHTLPLKVDRYLAKTRHLTAAQHGAYLLLLMTAWKMEDNALPNDDVFLARSASMDKRTWLHNKAAVLQFWMVGPDARLRQRTLDETRKYVVDVVNKKSAAGQASALKRKETTSTSVQQTVNTPPNNQIQIQIQSQIINRSDQDFENKFEEKKGKLVSASALLKAAEIARGKGYNGGIELGLELEGIFLGYITQQPRKPDRAFLAWVMAYVKQQ